MHHIEKTAFLNTRDPLAIEVRTDTARGTDRAVRMTSQRLNLAVFVLPRTARKRDEIGAVIGV